MRLQATLHVTNVSDRPVRLLHARLHKKLSYQDQDGIVAPYYGIPEELIYSPSDFQLTGDILPGATERVVCKFWVGVERGADGSVCIQPWSLRTKITLTDQYGMKHHTKKLMWQH